MTLRAGHHAWAGRPLRWLCAVLLALAVTASLAGCPSGHPQSEDTFSDTTDTSVDTTSPAATTIPSTDSGSPRTAKSLAGTWSGQANGTNQGSLTLTLQPTAAGGLSGSITLSAPATTLRVAGTFDGVFIKLSTVGGTAITYTGSVVDNSMSGTYQLNGATTASGQWYVKKAP